ncbi:MAG: hypothetical protein HYY84_07245 [Deltaproteobacteria bacterium]|nr:hypothetical protein [Deltaproteobacteria bacterium]
MLSSGKRVYGALWAVAAIGAVSPAVGIAGAFRGEVPVDVTVAVAPGADPCGTVSRLSASLGAMGVARSGRARAAQGVRVRLSRHALSAPWTVAVADGRGERAIRRVMSNGVCAEESAVVAAVIERAVRPVWIEARRGMRGVRKKTGETTPEKDRQECAKHLGRADAPSWCRGSAAQTQRNGDLKEKEQNGKTQERGTTTAAEAEKVVAPISLGDAIEPPGPHPERPSIVSRVTIGDLEVLTLPSVELLFSSALAGGMTREAQGGIAVGFRHSFSRLFSNRVYLGWRTPETRSGLTGAVRAQFLRLIDAVGFTPFRFRLRFEALVALQLVFAEITSGDGSAVSPNMGLGFGVAFTFPVGRWSIDVALRLTPFFAEQRFFVGGNQVMKLGAFDGELSLGGAYAF